MQTDILDKIAFYKKNGYSMTPDTLQIEITNRCPLHCKQCYKEPNGGSDLDFDIVKKILKEAYEIGIKKIMINGGEPLIYPYIIDTLKLCALYGFTVRTVTSGVNMDLELLHKLKETKAYLELAVSLNGSTKQIHELSRDGYEMAIDAIKLLCQEQWMFGLNWVSRSDNVFDFPNVVNLAKQYHVNDISVITNKIEGTGSLSDRLETKDYLFLINFINQHNKSEKLPKIYPQYCFPFLNYYIKDNVNKHRSFMCNAGLYSCCLNVHGKFKPCVHLPFEEDYPSIKEFWEKSIYLNKIRNGKNDTKENCKDCIYNQKCRSCFCMSVENQETLQFGMEQCPVKNLEVM